MGTSIYSDCRTGNGFKSAKALGIILGMSSSWCVDPGRLEDAIGGTLRAYCWGDAGRSGSVTRTVKLDDSDPCSHGIDGIFGMKFAQALTASGKEIMLTVEFHAAGNSITFTDWSLALG